MEKIQKELAAFIASNSSTLLALESVLDESVRSIDAMITRDVSMLTALESLLTESDKFFDVPTNIEIPSALTALESSLITACATIEHYLSNGIKTAGFTLAAFESFIDEAIKNIGDTEIATESIADKLLAVAKVNIDNRCKSLADCDNIMDEIATEAVKFNQCMESMAQAGRDLQSGIINKIEFKERIEPAVKELRAGCSIIKKVNPDYAAESVTLDDEDISTVREFIIGLESLINTKREELGGNPDTSLEAFIASCENMTISTEGAATYSLKTVFSEKKRDAKKLIKEAKNLLKEKEYEKAIEKYKKAKSLYAELKGELSKIPETELSHVIGISEGKKTDLRSTTNMSITKAAVSSYFDKKMTSCDEAIFKINNAHSKAKRKATESAVNFNAIIEQIANECDEGSDNSDDDDDDDGNLFDILDDDDDDDDLDDILDDDDE